MTGTAQTRPTPRYLDIGDKVWPLTRRFMGAHTFLYRRTGGRLGHTVPGVQGKMLLLDHVGAKSGVKRTSPLLYVRDGEDIVIIPALAVVVRHLAVSAIALVERILATAATVALTGQQRDQGGTPVNLGARRQGWGRGMRVAVGPLLLLPIGGQ